MNQQHATQNKKAMESQAINLSQKKNLKKRSKLLPVCLNVSANKSFRIADANFVPTTRSLGF